MGRVALLSNPRSTGNQALLPRVRAFCAAHPEIFHYEVEHADQIGEALATIARVKPCVLVINGGDGTVQAALTELHHGAHFGATPPPVAVLPNGKTNLIALDLGAEGDPITALARVVELARSDLEPHVVARELIHLSEAGGSGRAVLGMFLGGAGLADTMMYCRTRIYPLGLPNTLSHALAAMAWILSFLLGIRTRYLPPRPQAMQVQVRRAGSLEGRFAVLLVTTLERLLLAGPVRAERSGLKLLAIEHRVGPMLRVMAAAFRRDLGRRDYEGVHLESGDEIRLEGGRSGVILDGELFETGAGRPIILRPSAPVDFLRLAA